MRIVSLLPAATEWICAFGAEGDLVGRSHACDYPPAVVKRPAVTAATLTEEEDAATIDAQVKASVGQGLSLYEVDLEHLRALQPDLILTQAQCEVCAVSLPQLEEALADWMEARPQVLSIKPMTLKQVLDAGLRIGRAIGREAAAMTFIGQCEARLQRLHDRLGLRRAGNPHARPSVTCLEWIEPLMTAGHWMPDVVEMAGGRAVLAEKGTRSRYVDWDALGAADPEVIALMPCGFTIEQTRAHRAYLTEHTVWPTLQAVRAGHVYLFDGRAYFNRPGPRLYRSIELLAAALHPEPMAGRLNLQAWEAQPLAERAALHGPF